MRVGRTHAVNVIFIVKGRPEQNGLTECHRDIRRSLLIAEIAVDHHYGIDLLCLESLNDLSRALVIENEGLNSDTLVVDEAYLVGSKIILDILYKSLPSLLCGVLGKKGSSGAVGRISSHCDETYLNFVVKHIFFSNQKLSIIP